MYIKLNQKFDKFQYDEGKSQVNYAGIIEYNDFVLKQGGVLFVLPRKVRHEFQTSVMKIRGPVPPHTDSEIKCTINFYIQTELCITKFYRLSGPATTCQVENQTNGFIYNKEDLVCIGNFIANPGDAWLLDVTKIHAVDPLYNLKERVALTVCTDKYSYEDVKEMLHETGYL